MSTECQKTTAKAIPSTRRVTINDAAHMPQDYSTTFPCPVKRTVVLPTRH